MKEQDRLILLFQDLVSKLESTHDELNRLAFKKRVTSGRDFRRKMREIRATAKAATQASQNLEDELRKIKKEKRDGL
jgi:hypothetical protein